MSDVGRETGGVPSYVERETTQGERVRAAERIAELAERVNALRERTLTSEQVRDMVTGMRSSIAVSTVSRETFDALKTQVAEIKPPSMWKLVSGLAAFLLAVATIIWQASARVGDISLQSTILKMQVDGMGESIKRLEAAQQATQSKLDQVLIHQAKP